jgi:hypothetical protein
MYALFLSIALLACQPSQPTEPSETETSIVVSTPYVNQVEIDINSPQGEFGDIFRSINLDTGKKMLAGSADFDRIERLMCGDQKPCQLGPVRYWDRVEQGRFTLDPIEKGGTVLSNEDVLRELSSRGFPVLWTLRGTPAFLNPACSGCTIIDNESPVHIMREVYLAAEDESNKTGQEIDCRCESETWFYGVPTIDKVNGVGWLDYLENEVAHALTIFGPDTDFRVGIGNEPDTDHWDGTQAQFVQMWCASVGRLNALVASEDRSNVLIGGPDVSSWKNSIGATETPLLQELLEQCVGEEAPGFMTTHHYSEPGRFLIEESVDNIRSWTSDSDLPIGIGEYATALGHGAEAFTVCDETAMALKDGDVPIATGEESSTLCDHRGAADDVAQAFAMAEQDHDRLYRFEVWDWGTTDMLTTRMGLLGKDNLPKPTATAFWMMSKLRGEKVALVNQLDGSFPFHLAASHDDEGLVIVAAAQDRTVSEQFARGLLYDGYEFSNDVAWLFEACPALFGTEPDEQNVVDLANQSPSPEWLMEQCDKLDSDLAAALSSSLLFAQPRVGNVGESWTLKLSVPGVSGVRSLYRIDAYRNTLAESHRKWGESLATMSNDSTKEPNYPDAEQYLWEYLQTPIGEVEIVDGVIEIEMRPNSVVMIK